MRITLISSSVLILSLIAAAAYFLFSAKVPPNVLIIVMDTARQDHLSCYGYSRETSPNLDILAAQSKIYYNAYSTSSWTSSAHASLFTGLYPVAHKTTQENWIMPDTAITLAEVLGEAGYQTFGIVENPMLGEYAGFHQGFSQYFEAYRQSSSGSNENIAFFLFKKCLQVRNKQQPFFLFINFIAPHNPYDSSHQFQKRFVTDPSLDIAENQWQNFYLNRTHFSSAELQHLQDLYDAEILYVDYLVGKIMEELKKQNIWDNTVVIITSDHGENIGDHNQMGHVFSLYETTTKIPLIIYYPPLFSPNTKDYEPTQLTDIFPTLLRIAGIDTVQYPSQGRDMLEDHSRKNRTIFTEYYSPVQAINAFAKSDRENPLLHIYKRRLRSIIFNNKKFIWGSDGKHELYNLSVDSREQNNLIDQETTIKNEMLAKLAETVDTYSIDANDSAANNSILVDQETKERLQTLGYLPSD